MSLLWAVPPVAVAVAAVILLAQLRHMADGAADLTLQLHRLDEVRVAVAEVRAESAQTRQALRRCRLRLTPPPVPPGERRSRVASGLR